MKKKKFEEVKRGDYFKRYNVVYRKTGTMEGVSLIGKDYSGTFFFYGDNVIPVTVTIKVKEK